MATKTKKKQKFELVKPHYHRMHDIIKFYSKCSEQQINALKYYKGMGVTFMTKYLIEDKIPPQGVPYYDFTYNYIHECLGIKTPKNTDVMLKNVKSYVENFINLQLDQINVIDSIFERSDVTKLTDEVIVYRGMECIGKENMKVGDTYTFKNFISTSIDRNVAERYASGPLEVGNHKCLFVIRNLKDIPYLYLQPRMGVEHVNPDKMLKEISPQSELFEYILPRGIQVKINEVKQEYSTDNKLNYIVSPNQIKNIFKKEYDPNKDFYFIKFTVYYCDVVKIIEKTPIGKHTITNNTEIYFNLDDDDMF